MFPHYGTHWILWLLNWKILTRYWQSYRVWAEQQCRLLLDVPFGIAKCLTSWKLLNTCQISTEGVDFWTGIWGSKLASQTWPRMQFCLLWFLGGFVEPWFPFAWCAEQPWFPVLSCFLYQQLGMKHLRNQWKEQRSVLNTHFQCLQNGLCCKRGKTSAILNYDSSRRWKCFISPRTQIETSTPGEKKANKL